MEVLLWAQNGGGKTSRTPYQPILAPRRPVPQTSALLSDVPDDQGVFKIPKLGIATSPPPLLLQTHPCVHSAFKITPIPTILPSALNGSNSATSLPALSLSSLEHTCRSATYRAHWWLGSPYPDPHLHPTWLLVFL